MKILIALHQMMDLGGIINHTEQLIGGLKDLGHTVHLKELVWTQNPPGQKKEGPWEIGPSGIPYAQGRGWNFAREDRIGYLTAPSLLRARQILSGYDLIIWTSPVPSKNKFNLGNSDWPELYDLPSRVKQIGFIHDGNVRNGPLHLLHVAERFTGLACVHSCAYASSDYIPVPRKLVLNPQHNPIRQISPWSSRADGFVNMQTFKAWKHVHELVAAIPYLPPKSEDELREIAGRGIEYQYMTSEDKCKEAYYHPKVEGEWFSGDRIWEAAIEWGMVHHDYWDTEEVTAMLQSAKILVDPSWSKKYSAWGGHWNRVVVDAMMNGAVPVATELGMGDDLFKAGEHYIAIPSGGENPRRYAEILDAAGHMSEAEAKPYREAALDILPLFDRKVVAQSVLDLAEGDTALNYKPNAALVAKSKDILFEHYGIA